jgi:hypothetical protein
MRNKGNESAGGASSFGGLVAMTFSPLFRFLFFKEAVDTVDS